MSGNIVTIDSEEVDLDKLARDELLRLQRQYRLMESDRKQYAEESGKNVGRQRRMLEFLQNEKEDLLTDLHNALSKQNQEIDKETIKTILSILDRYSLFESEINYQLGQIAEMEEQVDKITRRVIHQKLKVQALFGHSLTVAQADKRKRVLEDRLYHVTTLFDTQVANNQYIMQEINLNLMERGRFHARYEAYKQKLARMKRQMAIIVDNATSTYDAREEATAKIHSLRERNDKESKQHVLEMKEYQRILHHDEKGHGFMVVKSKPRPLIEDDEVRTQRLDRAKEKQLDDLLLAYKISFRDLLRLANTHDVETLVQSYMAQEQQNFARFKYISDLNNEVEVIYEAIHKLKLEIEEKSALQHEETKKQKKTLRKLEKEHKNTLQTLNDYEDQKSQAESNMELIITMVEDLFKLAECGNEPVIQLLGNKSGIQPRNVLLCLAVLEHKVTELQQIKAELEVRKFVELEGGQLQAQKQGPTVAPGPKNKLNGGPFKPNVVVTGRLDAGGEEEDDTEEHEPLTYNEVREAVFGRMNQFAAPDQRLSTTSSIMVPGSSTPKQSVEAKPEGQKPLSNVGSTTNQV